MPVKTKDKNLIIYDAHACPPFAADKNLSALVRYKNAGVTFVSINTGFGDMTHQEILSIIDHFKKFIHTHSSEYSLVHTIDDICHCKHENKLGIAFDLEGVNSIGEKVELLDTYMQLGVKQLQLVYNKNNTAGGGCQDNDTGLTMYGKALVRRMNDIGIVIDCSHTGYKTTLDIMNTSDHPVIFSHSNPLALCDHPRNIRDEQIKACALTGGVIGINGVSIFLGYKNPTMTHLIEHIDYVAQLVGTAHIGLGLDYALDHEDTKVLIKSNPALFPQTHKYDDVELLAPEIIPHLYSGLKNKGYTHADIQAILGGNFLRVAKEVWKN